MIVRVLAVGRLRGLLAPVVTEYETRAARYWRLEVMEVASGAKGRQDPEAVREAEGERLLARIPEAGTVVALTREGRSLSSPELAHFLEGQAVASVPSVTFIVGGAFGLSSRILERAHLHLSLSSMTLPHELARTVLAEQLYRAGSILRGEPYHKGG